MCKDCEGCENVNVSAARIPVMHHCSVANYVLCTIIERCPWPSKRVEKKIDISIEIINLKAMADSFCMTAYEKETTRKMAIKGKKLLDSIISKCL